MEVKVLGIDLSDGFNSVFDFEVDSGDFTIAGMEIPAAINSALLAKVVSSEFSARIQLLENEGRVVELATPMLMTTNQEVSRVFVGQETPLVVRYSASTSQTTSSTGGGTVITNPTQAILVPDTELRSVGTTLLLTPNITADRAVALRMLVEQSNVNGGGATIPVPIGDELVDANVDVVQTRTYSGTVATQDHVAVAIGGLIEEVASNSEKKVPVLGDIPRLGFLFNEIDNTRSRRELVIIIKPHINKTPVESELASDSFIERNSIHPGEKLDLDSKEIYKNPKQDFRDYQLCDEYKLYR